MRLSKREDSLNNQMKNLIRIMLLAILLLVMVGESQAQSGVSPNGEFTFEFIDDVTVVTRFDTVNVGFHPLSINDEGHLYISIWRDCQEYRVYLSNPFFMDEVSSSYGFISYQNGEPTQLLHLNKYTVSYSNLLSDENVELFRTEPWDHLWINQ